ncbi:MAG: protease complex subunit PrcB family protein [Vicinamibacterales bacterium]
MMELILGALMMLQTGSPGVKTIVNSSMSSIEEPRQMVARNQTEWAALWRAHAGDKPAPKVDFDTTTVVAVFLGNRMSAGFSAEITGTHPQGAALVVEWAERRPDRDMVTAQVITTPAAIAAIPKFAGEIRFEKAKP